MSGGGEAVTNDERTRLRELESKATPGPWVVVSDLPDFGIASTSHPTDPVVTKNRLYRAPGRSNYGCTEQDAKFIAASREAISDLLSEVERLESKLSTAVNYLEQGKIKFTPSTTNSDVDCFIADYKRGQEESQLE